MGTCIEFEQQFANSAPRDGVQVTSRLVRKQHRRLRNERTSQRHALLLSTGELPWIVSGAGAQSDTPKGLLQPRGVPPELPDSSKGSMTFSRAVRAGMR